MGSYVRRETTESGSEQFILRRAVAGDGDAWASLLEPHRERLKRIIRLRMDPRLRYRVDPSDVLQDAVIEAFRALPGYASQPQLPFFLWLRWLTGRTLQVLHRKHLDVQAREAGREVRFDGAGFPDATSAVLVDHLVGQDTRPSDAVGRAELRSRLEAILDGLDARDREILTLRHFEELTTEESARVLGIERSAASKRYLRALQRLRRLIGEMPGELGGSL